MCRTALWFSQATKRVSYVSFLILQLSATAAFGQWTEQDKITANDATPDDWFTYSVALDGDTALIGSPRRDNGTVYEYVRIADVWTERARVTASDAAVDDFFGGSVSLDGDTALVGAYGDNDAGSVYVIERNGGTWTEQTKLTASDPAPDSGFAYSVSLDGDIALVGAPFRNNGTVYEYVLDGGVWIEQAKLTASDGARFDDFGVSVSLDGDTVLVGPGAGVENINFSGMDSGLGSSDVRRHRVGQRTSGLRLSKARRSFPALADRNS